MSTEFIRSTAKHHLFKLDCHCHYIGEVGVPVNHKLLVQCPDCGSLYFMTKPTGLFTQPRLISVCSVGAQAHA